MSICCNSLIPKRVLVIPKPLFVWFEVHPGTPLLDGVHDCMGIEICLNNIAQSFEAGGGGRRLLDDKDLRVTRKMRRVGPSSTKICGAFVLALFL